MKLLKTVLKLKLKELRDRWDRDEVFLPHQPQVNKQSQVLILFPKAKKEGAVLVDCSTVMEPQQKRLFLNPPASIP